MKERKIKTLEAKIIKQKDKYNIQVQTKNGKQYLGRGKLVNTFAKKIEFDTKKQAEQYIKKHPTLKKQVKNGYNK